MLFKGTHEAQCSLKHEWEIEHPRSIESFDLVLPKQTQAGLEIQANFTFTTLNHPQLMS